MSAMQDMTKGGAAGHLLRYAVPLMLGNWFQLAYNAVDSIIAGRFIGKDALAAEGIAGPVMNLVILGITGVCLGAGVLMSEFFGAKDGESLRRELATTVRQCSARAQGRCRRSAPRRSCPCNSARTGAADPPGLSHRPRRGS